MSSANSIDFDTPEDFDDGGNFVRQVGVYHFAMQSISVGSGPKGGAINGFMITAEVLGGTVASEVSHTINLVYFDPKLTDSDKKVALTKKQRAKLFIAIGLLNPNDKGKAVKIELDEHKLRGRQFVARLEVDGYRSKEGQTYLEISNAELDIWHVDDPHAAGIPKNEAAIKLIPAALRHDAKWFEAIYAKKGATAPASPSGNGGQKSGTPANQPATAAVATSRVNLDDL